MTIRCISPIDGSVYAERETLSPDAARAAVARAARAQKAWAARPLDERIALVQKATANVGAMNEEIVPELAWQMGRPVRYGGEFGGFNERATYMAKIAHDALAPMEFEDSDRFRRLIKRVPHGVVLVIAPWNYPFMTAHQHHCAGADRRQCRGAETRLANAAGGRAHGAGLPRGGRAGGCLSERVSGS